MSGAVVIACIPVLLLFAKMKEPVYERKNTLLNRWDEDGRIEKISATMDLKQREKTKSENGSQENFIMNTSTV